MRNLLNKTKEQAELFVLMLKLFYIKVSLCFWTAKNIEITNKLYRRRQKKSTKEA